ncbi:hypothetical protein GH714_020166 [Hevea brasiliensis]|uniref:Pectinesterase inhibitor domain-containing protein n=1 Tax=Hevea brasiliensis TaxID=3981 RepID=A0A6A6KSU8_HEVBR|nr:hypothetical protein GH714_020166 [Hevea brasiliensis]
MKDSAKTQRYIHVLSTSKRTEPIFKPALNECVEEYKRVAASFRSACLEVKDGEYETANYDTLTAADYAGNCEKALVNAKAHIQSFSDGIQVTNDHAKKEAIKECAKYFQETVGMLNLGGLEGDTASLDVHYALDNDQYCESALADAKVHAETISSAIEKWKNFYSVAYAAVVAVENSQLH